MSVRVPHFRCCLHPDIPEMLPAAPHPSGQKEPLIHLFEKADGFLALIVAVNDQIEVVAGFREQSDKLQSRLGGRSDVVNQHQVAVWGERNGIVGSSVLLDLRRAELPGSLLYSQHSEHNQTSLETTYKFVF